MSTGGGNLYPNWLGSASLSIPSNSINTSVQVQTALGLSSYATTVNVVPVILQGFVSTTVLDTSNPSEMLSYTVPASGWYKTDFNGVASHAPGSNWTSMTQLDWFVKRNNVVQSNTILLCDPQYVSGDSASAFVTLNGGGIFPASAGDILEWTVDANASPAITTGFNGGFSWITLQKVG